MLTSAGKKKADDDNSGNRNEMLTGDEARALELYAATARKRKLGKDAEDDDDGDDEQDADEEEQVRTHENTTDAGNSTEASA